MGCLVMPEPRPYTTIDAPVQNPQGIWHEATMIAMQGDAKLAGWKLHGPFNRIRPRLSCHSGRTRTRSEDSRTVADSTWCHLLSRPLYTVVNIVLHHLLKGQLTKNQAVNHAEETSNQAVAKGSSTTRSPSPGLTFQMAHSFHQHCPLLLQPLQLCFHFWGTPPDFPPPLVLNLVPILR
jgi:hypothetical protein